MAAPLYTVFEKRLSKKPSLPSPSVRPQSILVKEFSFPPSPTSTTSADDFRSSMGGLYGRRGSNSSNSSTSSLGHDCQGCSVYGEHTETRTHALSTSSRDHCRSSSSMTASFDSEGLSRPRRVQWVDQV
ncbi:hypothetical protein BGZ75_008995 [Mortierella antarctica]|nr:hypothetical protein BGZ75_008995 [Mortierella antarctica]